MSDRDPNESLHNIPLLLRDLADQGAHLADQQLNLLKAELSESVTDVKLAVGSLAGAAVLGIAGLGVALMGLSFLLGIWIENTPLATLIVGLITLIIAFFLYLGGKKKIAASELAPTRTQHTMERAKDIADTKTQEKL